MGMVTKFMEMVELLFKSVKVVVCLNGGIMRTFNIERRVKQGSPC